MLCWDDLELIVMQGFRQLFGFWLFLGKLMSHLKPNNTSFVWQILCSYVVDADHLAYTSITRGSMNCFVNLEIVALIWP